MQLAHGSHLRAPDLEGELPAHRSLCRVLAPGGALVAVAEVERIGPEARIQPRVVLLRPAEAAEGGPATEG